MTTITISLADDQLAKLQEKADRIGVSPEELARVSVEELLTRPEEEFKRDGTSDLVLGAFADDPALIDQVTDDAPCVEAELYHDLTLLTHNLRDFRPTVGRMKSTPRLPRPCAISIQHLHRQAVEHHYLSHFS